MSDTESETVSLDPHYVETSFVYDRLYQAHSLEEEIYCVPVDEEEEDRIETQHQVLNDFFGNKLFFGSITSNPLKVLDCGYGQAHWAIAVAQRYPNCEVTGVDIYPTDLLNIPHNVTLECDDLNRRLTEVYALNEFDVIQSRCVGPGIHKDRWSSYVQELMRYVKFLSEPGEYQRWSGSLRSYALDGRQLELRATTSLNIFCLWKAYCQVGFGSCSRLLKPGGWLQMIEYYFNFQSHSGLLNSTHALYEWGSKYRLAMDRDRNPRIGSMSKLADLMRDARMVEVQYQNCSLPIGGWSRDAREKDIGLRNLNNFDRMLDSYGIWPFRKRLAMTQEEVRALNDRAREEARNPRFKTYIPLTVAWARKPGGPQWSE